MRGVVAKRLRKEAYGKDGSPRFREYKLSQAGFSWFERLADGVKKKVREKVYHVRADDARSRYQRLKREWSLSA